MKYTTTLFHASILLLIERSKQIMLSFNPVKLLNKDEYRLSLSLLENHFRCCDYTYANLLCWGDVYNTHFAKDNSGYYFSIVYENQTKYLCPIVKESDFLQSLKVLCNYEKANSQNTLELICVPVTYAEIIRQQYKYSIINETRNNFDYLYLSEKLTDFSGKALHSKKNHKNKF